MERAGILRQNNFIERLLIKPWFWIFTSIIMFSIPIYRSVNRELPPDLPVLYTLPEYELTDENGKSFGSKDLKGKPYIANFHFTSCPTVCPELMKETQVIQKRVKGLGTKVGIVSFTVDPETDKPEKLFEHARTLGANPYVWKFLTETEANLRSVIVDGFKVAMGDKEVSNNLYDIAHTQKYFLVDEQGRIRSMYSNTNKEINKMMIDLGLVVNKLIHSPRTKE